MVTVTIESVTFALPLKPRNELSVNAESYLTMGEARYWNAKLDHWLYARRVRRKFTMADSIRADIAAVQ